MKEEEIIFLREQFCDFCAARLLNYGFHIHSQAVGFCFGGFLLLLFGFPSSFPDPKDFPGLP